MSMSPDQEIQVGLTVLDLIDKVITEWRKAKSGTVKPEEVLQRLNSLTQRIADNDKAADSSIDEKFPK